MVATNIPAAAVGASAQLALEPKPPWSVLLVEDDQNTVRQIREYFANRQFAGRNIALAPITDWDHAFGLIRERKADLAILDIYRGDAAQGGERVGERVLDDFQRTGFIPVVIHTNLPEGREGRRNEFVRLIAKTDGLGRLSAEVEALFATRIPQLNRAILNHLDRTLCDYMWNFVTKEWPRLKDIADRPEFLRLLLNRLSYSFARTEVEKALKEAFENYDAPAVDPEKIHPAEFYVMPPLSHDPSLGDVRQRKNNDTAEYFIVLWPTCDMVSSGDRKPKVDRVLCARAKLLAGFPEAQEHAANPSARTRDHVMKLMANNRDRGRGSAESVHFLPGFLGIPELVVDFRELEVLGLNDVRKLDCLAVIASPYAEQMNFRFDSYRGRIGVPDLDLEVVISKLGPTPAPKPQGPK
jgi:hypothetical protein